MNPQDVSQWLSVLTVIAATITGAITVVSQIKKDRLSEKVGVAELGLKIAQSENETAQELRDENRELRTAINTLENERDTLHRTIATLRFQLRQVIDGLRRVSEQVTESGGKPAYRVPKGIVEASEE